MKAILVTQELKGLNPDLFKTAKVNSVKVLSEIPKSFFSKNYNDGRRTDGYHTLDNSIHEADGFYPFEQVVFDSTTHKQGLNIIFDTDKFVYEVEPLSQEELDAIALAEAEKPVIQEFQNYLKRAEDGKNAYLKLSAELRLAKLSGQINDTAHTVIEDTLVPVRDEVMSGQWISGLNKLEAIGTSIIGEAFYNRLHTQLTAYINENY